MKKKITFLLVFILFIFVSVIVLINFNNDSFSNTYTVTWKNYDGSIIYQEVLEKGDYPYYKGDTPDRSSDDIADYSFGGWIPNIKKVEEDISYVARYDVNVKDFGIVSDVESGFYESGFNLNLYSTNNSKIYYTLDSTTPTTNSTLYDGSLLIEDNSSDPNLYSSISNISSMDVYIPNYLVDKCVILKAIAVDSDGNISNMIIKTFFVNYNKKSGYDNMPIISMVVDPSDLFDYEKGIYTTGKIYDEGEKIGYPETYPANYNQKGIEWEREADFTYFEADKSFSFNQSIGIRIHGGWSRAFNQKSFNLYARSEYSGKDTFEKPFFDTARLKTCMLRSGGYRDTYSTKIRDGMNQTLSKNEAFMTQDNYPCILFLNGEYWGIYYLQERFTDSYVEEHYGIDNDNVIIVKNDVLDEGNPEDMLLYEELINFFNNNDFSLNLNYQKVSKYIDVEEFASYMATELYIGNADWPGNNVAMWRSKTITNRPYEDGKWHFMFYDTDDCSGMISKCNYDSNPFINTNHWKYGPLDERCILGLMLNKLLSNSDFRNLFVLTFNRIATTNFSEEKVNDYLEEATKRLSIPMNNFYNRFVSLNDQTYNRLHFKSNVEVIKDFYSKRDYYTSKYLSEVLSNYN